MDAADAIDQPLDRPEQRRQHGPLAAVHARNETTERVGECGQHDIVESDLNEAECGHQKSSARSSARTR
jgi:hypothetical protein